MVTMLRGWLPSVIAAVLLVFAAPETTWAEHVLERIGNTGVFNAGTRADALPFAYRDKKERLVGFSVDLLGEIHKRLEQRFGRRIEMKLLPTTASNRIEMVASQIIDIECGITTPTWKRQEQVDFSIPFFGNGTRIVTLRTTAERLQDLRGKRIAVAAGTTTAGILAQNVPEIVLVEVPDMDTGFAMFERGEVDGLSNVGVVLRAMIEKSLLKSKVVLLPRTEEFSYESMACILPKDDSDWRAFVNRVLADLLDGVDQYQGSYIEIYDRWFGPRGAIYFPLDYRVAQRLAASVIWLK
ncbi:MAG: amino acid ABC transporter substrate-binding protein [Candidatus Contendobacter sp.]|nr:amino acid ABC transporter substrate-binding protein [Candidatus Contendobacter sp.]MDS4059565.1 amino acid ABC transporter substrate-binding protein [Candidatus Contendobacter sp.]